VEAENALNRANIERKYRPEEYQIAVERLNQLKSLMPTQRLVVQVPFTDHNNDSRIFCSQGGQLRPTLLAWHGPPPIQGEESTILIEGKNFSVHDTHVIAGGQPAKQVLVSRNILEVTISKDACPSPGADGMPILDISVATPNGVSNHLLTKMRPPCPGHDPVKGKTHDRENKTSDSKSGDASAKTDDAKVKVAHRDAKVVAKVPASRSDHTTP
jgi:hypothetical protein